MPYPVIDDKGILSAMKTATTTDRTVRLSLPESTNEQDFYDISSSDQFKSLLKRKFNADIVIFDAKKWQIMC